MTMLVLIGIFLIAVSLLAPRYGADSRDGHDWSSATPRRRSQSGKRNFDRAWKPEITCRPSLTTLPDTTKQVYNARQPNGG